MTEEDRIVSRGYIALSTKCFLGGQSIINVLLRNIWLRVS
jgi:hypothetical protein